MKALIKVGYACNEHCAFCHTQDERHVQGTTAEVDAKIRRAAALRHSMIVLSGGEPTIRPELLHWARLSASLGLDFGLVTNGLRLSYPALVQQLVHLRLRYVYLSLHGGSAPIHDRMVRTEGAFGPAMAAVEHLHRHAEAHEGLDLTLNCVVTQHNVDHLVELVDRTRPFPRWRLKFSMVEPKGGGRALPQLVPRVSYVAARVREAIEHGLGQDPERHLLHGGLPLCLLPEHEHRFDDLRTHGFRTMVEIGEPDLFPVDDLNKQKAPPCEGCALAGPCPGLFLAYHQRHGAGELRPVATGPRANAFNYVLERVIAHGVPDDACPLRDATWDMGVSPWDLGRDLFVRHRGRVALYRAQTRDFADDELRDIKLVRGQVYLDASPDKDAPDDFARDLVPLDRAPVCQGCPHHDACTGSWEPAFDDRFARDDEQVRAILGQLRGTVLDLGCGHAPYLDALAARAEAGEIHYVGVDPDPQAIAELRQRAPWAELHVGHAEALPPEIPQAFDHLLVLRSWNHLADPTATLAALSARLRPGGSLLVVDNVAFGLARGRAQAQRAEQSPAAHEHHRNDDLAAATRAIARVPGLSTRTQLAVPVTPGRSNQWVLHLRHEPAPSTHPSPASAPAFGPSAELIA